MPREYVELGLACRDETASGEVEGAAVVVRVTMRATCHCWLSVNATALPTGVENTGVPARPSSAEGLSG
jgi:hypothetical protein